MGKRILVTSGKGGTGKTSVTAGIASCLAALGRRVVCVDADVGLRNLDLALGLTDTTALDFGDVIAGHVSLDEALSAPPGLPGLSLLAAPSELRTEQTEPEAFARLMAGLAERFDYCFVDSPAGLGAGFRMAAAGCDRALVVSLLEPAALRDAARAVEALERVGMTGAALVINRVRPQLLRVPGAANADDAMDTVGLPLLGVVPEDVAVICAGNRNVPVILYTRKGAAQAYLDMARRLDGQRVPPPRSVKARY
ncbi:MAG: P-loop NTPase [Oscillospiraceae bacterium]|nr:P-loop NTPase [Oscillospiraceae bacterium]